MDLSSSAYQRAARFPRAFLHASAKEYGPVRLHVVSGAIPSDLTGSLYLASPVGSVVSGGLPTSSNSHIWNGDGLIHRFDFLADGSINLLARQARTPCYWADFASRPGSAAARLGFRDWGMARFSPLLGMRNQPNTALVPMRFSDGEPTRLLLTFDGGRPYEIDPVSLELVTPMGRNEEWQSGIPVPWPFPPVLSTAHPVFDTATATLFTINYGRSSLNLLATIPLFASLAKVLKKLVGWLTPVRLVWARLLNPLLLRIDRFLGVRDFVHLLAWDGAGALRRWELVDQSGSPVSIRQSLHQIGVTEDFIVLADTSLKFGLAQLLPGPLPFPAWFKRMLRASLTSPQQPDTALYVLSKSDLVADQPRIVVRSLKIQLETGHFLVDHDNPGGRITLYAAHENAADVSEYIRPEDRSAYDASPIDPALKGMISVGAMDVGCLGRYVIDGVEGTLLTHQLTHDQRYTWGVGLYACRQDAATDSTSRAPHRSIYWQSLGFWPELLTRFIYRLYRHYPHRLIPLPQLLLDGLIAGRRPSTLFRLDSSSMSIVDAYAFPQASHTDATGMNWICGSPQFIPRVSQAHPTQPPWIDPDVDGWIICVATGEQHKELWIFDAAALSSGPLCRLSHPDFDPGYTVHTAWLQSITPRTADYRVDARSDYEPLLRKASPEVRDLFESHVYPNVSSCRSSPQD